jgi:hypothetical protein
MANSPAAGPCHGKFARPFLVEKGSAHRKARLLKGWTIFAGVVLFASLVLAQNAPQITGVDPASGKVNDTITVSGDNLGKASVSSVYLSDDKNDYKATIVSQSDDKIAMKVPAVKPGGYNISLQVGDKLFIKPVRFKVEE